MSLFNQLVGGGHESVAKSSYSGQLGMTNAIGIKSRTFREQIQDQISYHQARITDLEGVLESMTPEVEKFVEAIQKVNG